MILLSGADLVLPDRVLAGATLVLEGDRIAEILSSEAKDLPPQGGSHYTEDTLSLDFPDHYIVPGFIDVHVHGIEGTDALDGGSAIATMAERLPRYGVTAFCPTSIACDPATLRQMLAGVRLARTTRPPGGARVLPAHLESNFINPEYKGAQPLACLRGVTLRPEGTWSGAEVLDEIAAARPDVGIVTLAPELDGALELIADLVSHGHHVSLGHSGATYEQALAGIRAGARQATHLFNRMPALGHRVPGLAGAVLESDEVVAELICDGVHVHPAMMRAALAAKRPERIMAITDGTAGSGLPKGSRVTLGGYPITIRDAAYLDDGTIAGSSLTMDRAFAKLVSQVGLSLSDAATVCATTPARALGLQGFGVVAAGAVADLAILDLDLNVVQTWVAGTLAWERKQNFRTPEPPFS
ncbi:MAG TPA: N-acetylglucosamine-6-phosphate deacetylase [Vicinamibacterales bacterium]|nr:N-acetylglucosamine-6-phosphate deacetylase [Vicinamibacterales bacterium]